MGADDPRLPERQVATGLYRYRRLSAADYDGQPSHHALRQPTQVLTSKVGAKAGEEAVGAGKELAVSASHIARCEAQTIGDRPSYCTGTQAIVDRLNVGLAFGGPEALALSAPVKRILGPRLARLLSRNAAPKGGHARLAGLRQKLADERGEFDPLAMLGARGTQVTSKTLLRRDGYRIDVENPAPGARPGQLHLQDDVGNKYLYDFDAGEFPGYLARWRAGRPGRNGCQSYWHGRAIPWAMNS